MNDLINEYIHNKCELNKSIEFIHAVHDVNEYAQTMLQKKQTKFPSA